LVAPYLAPLPLKMGSDEAAEDGPKPRTQPHLMPQDAATVDASKLTALTPEVVRLKTSFPSGVRHTDAPSHLVPLLFHPHLVLHNFDSLL
jgi:hypothetical protein